MNTNQIKEERKAKKEEYFRLYKSGVKTNHKRMKKLAEEIFDLDKLINAS